MTLTAQVYDAAATRPPAKDREPGPTEITRSSLPRNSREHFLGFPLLIALIMMPSFPMGSVYHALPSYTFKLRRSRINSFLLLLFCSVFVLISESPKRDADISHSRALQPELKSLHPTSNCGFISVRCNTFSTNTSAMFGLIGVSSSGSTIKY